jgi:tRNA threonylcarbamoyladenosine biosynthesis protein TsaE
MKTVDHSGDAGFRVISTSEVETDLLGSRLAAALEAGAVVAMIGNLGSGKTRLVRSVAEALGVERREVASPTFVLVHEYEGRFPIYHFDAYRLQSAGEFLNLGADEYMNSDGVCFVEWADRIENLLPADHLRVTIAVTGETTREFQFLATGPKSSRIVASLMTSPPP